MDREEPKHLAPGELKILWALRNPVCAKCGAQLPYLGKRCKCGSRKMEEKPISKRFGELVNEIGLNRTSLSEYLVNLQDLMMVTRDYRTRKYTILDLGIAELEREGTRYQIAISKTHEYLIKHPDFEIHDFSYYYLDDLGMFGAIIWRTQEEHHRNFKWAQILGLAKTAGLIPKSELKSGNVSSRTLEKIRNELFPKLKRVMIIEHWDVDEMFGQKGTHFKSFIREVVKSGLPDYRKDLELWKRIMKETQEKAD